MKLVSSSGERDLYESLAEIYSIIITLDGLEKAYIKDVVTEAEYTETCTRLLKQYKSSLGDESVSREFVDLETFKRTWGVSLSMLIVFLVPASNIWLSWSVLAQPNDSASGFQRLSNKPHTAHLNQVARGLEVLPVVHRAVSSWPQRRTSLHSSTH